MIEFKNRCIIKPRKIETISVKWIIEDQFCSHHWWWFVYCFVPLFSSLQYFNIFGIFDKGQPNA